MQQNAKTVTLTSLLSNPALWPLPRRRGCVTRNHWRNLRIRGPVITENLLDDIYYCAEWAEQRYILVRDPESRPIFILTPERVHSALYRLIGSLNASAVLNRPCWTIEELIAPNNFARFCDWCADYEAIRTVIQIAKEWVNFSDESLNAMETSASAVVQF